MVLAHESFVFAWFLRISKWVNQSILLQLLPMSTNARIQKVLSEGANSATLTTFFFFFRGERIQISLKAGHHRPGSKMALHWHADDGPTLNAGLVALRISGDLVQYC